MISDESEVYSILKEEEGVGVRSMGGSKRKKCSNGVLVEPIDFLPFFDGTGLWVGFRSLDYHLCSGLCDGEISTAQMAMELREWTDGKQNSLALRKP